MNSCGSKALRQFAPFSSFNFYPSSFLELFYVNISIAECFQVWQFHLMQLEGQLGRTFLEVLSSQPVFLLFYDMLATSKSSTASDECLQSPFKVLTVTVVLLPQPSIHQARFSLQNFLDYNC